MNKCVICGKNATHFFNERVGIDVSIVKYGLCVGHGKIVDDYIQSSTSTMIKEVED